MKIYLVRHAHAKTRANLEGILVYDNQKNKGLTEKGKKQAKRLAKELIKFKIDKIFVSDAKRTYETILPFIKIRKDIPVEKNKKLNEGGFGIFSGLTGEEAKKKYPKIFSAVNKDDWNIPIPKGENMKDVAARMDAFLAKIRKESKKSRLKNILLITHSTNIQAFLRKHGKTDGKKSDPICFKNTSISVFNSKNGLIQPVEINNISHLKT